MPPPDNDCTVKLIVVPGHTVPVGLATMVMLGIMEEFMVTVMLLDMAVFVVAHAASLVKIQLIIAPLLSDDVVKDVESVPTVPPLCDHW